MIDSFALREFYSDCNNDPAEFMRRMQFVNLLIYMTMEDSTIQSICERGKECPQ